MIGSGESLVVGVQIVVSLIEGDHLPIAFPILGEDLGSAMLVEPTNLGITQQENTSEHDFGDAFRMRFGVGEREGAAP